MLARRLFVATLVAIAAIAHAARKPHVLIISIDGMRPDYVTKADKHGLKIPTLRAFFAHATYAEGVIGVVPTLTYPSHTAMMTGVWPAQHGIYGNQKFNPFAEGKEQVTDAADIKVETLWEAAHKAGYTVASVGWPVTTGAKYIDWLLPANAAFEGGDPDGASVSADPNTHYDNPAGLREQLGVGGPHGEKLDVNDQRHAWQLAVIRRFHPDFMTAHVGYLDHEEHGHGPFSQQANAALEYADRMVGELIAAERAVDPQATIFIVSDHGFLPTDHAFAVNALLMPKGLLDVEHKTWEAAAFNTGGTSAIILRNPADAKTAARVRDVIDEAAKNPAYGIGRVYSHEELVARGGRPDAFLMLDAKSEWRFASGTKRLVADAPNSGAHGQMPEHPELRSAFMMVGPQVAQHRDLGVIDMRQIAPTIAQVLHVALPAAKMKPVNFGK